MNRIACLSLVSGVFLSGTQLWAGTPDGSERETVQKAVKAARCWLAANAAGRAAFEPTLEKYGQDIDAVIEELMPKGSDKYKDIKGYEVKGDSFTIPELLERNRDHPFNYYVPPHYVPAKKMGLMLWMHGGGTYKPGRNAKRKSIQNKLDELKVGDYICVAPEACHGVNFPKGAVMDKLAGRWSVPASERYLSDIINEFMHRYNIDPNRIVLWGYSMGGVGAYNHAMRTDRFAVVGIGGGSWSYGTFDAMLNTPAFIWHGKNDSFWKSKTDCRNRFTDVSHARYADEILTDLGYEHKYIETDGGHYSVNLLNGKSVDITKTYFYSGTSGYVIGKYRNPFPERVIAMTPRGSYESHDPLTSGDVYYQPESLHDRWVSIERYTPGPVRVHCVNKKGRLRKADSYQEWLSYSATRGVSKFNGAKIDIENLGNNVFKATTKHVDSYSIWLHSKMVDFRRPIKVTTNGVSAEYSCKPSLLNALKSYERRYDWGLIYPATISVRVVEKDK
ncbi:MAG: alpha/beta hydrolase-fold protein [Planctomycetota bacterium]|jgi:dienelactone hydrolase|nr:alpha/beta hydrolase-fold protein [Planctomycetota bacterium]